jgi:hypothetical protein
MQSGSKVIIKCPVYRNGRKFTGIVKSILNDVSVMVLIDGNKKATKFCKCWIIN